MPPLIYLSFCLFIFSSLPEFGAGRGWTVNDANRLMHQMLVEDYLAEYSIASANSQYPTDMMFIKLGSAVQVSERTQLTTCTARYSSAVQQHLTLVCSHFCSCFCLFSCLFRLC